MKTNETLINLSQLHDHDLKTKAVRNVLLAVNAVLGLRAFAGLLLSKRKSLLPPYSSLLYLLLVISLVSKA